MSKISLIALALCAALVVAQDADADADGSSTTSSGNVQCLDANGNAVDWFVAFKLRDGFSYTAMTSNDNGAWESTSYNLQPTSGTPSGPVYTTLNQIYTGAANSWASFNDEEPSGQTTYTMGHSKGVIASVTGGNGFFLSHSVPMFPPVKASGYGIGKNAWTFGQSFLCVSVTEQTLNTIVEQWVYTNPQIYDSNVASGSQLTALAGIIAGSGMVTAGGTNAQTFSTLGGVQYTYLVKNGAWGQDIYEGLVAPYYSANLYVDSWAHGSVLPSYCTGTSDNYQWQVNNVNQLNLNGNTWYETDDHSKWCVSTAATTNTNAVCLGDINRVQSQFTRGGGMVCTSDNNAVFQALTNMVSSTQACGAASPSSSYSSPYSSPYYSSPYSSSSWMSENAEANNRAAAQLALGLKIGGASLAVVAVAVVAVAMVVRRRRAAEAVAAGEAHVRLQEL